MKTGFIGLGRMGYNLVLQALEKNQEMVVFNRSTDKVKAMSVSGAIPSFSLVDLVNKLPDKKVIWLMVTAGSAVDDLVDSLIPLLKSGDIIIDGGNSYYKDSIQRSKRCEQHGIDFMDIGTSGGIDGARYGACMMIGGAKESFEYIEPFINEVTVKDGYGYLGGSGSGHYVKMIHNGIEYGMMQSIGEGYSLLKNSDFDLDIANVSKIYANGSVIRSWLIDLVLEAVKGDPELGEFNGKVDQSGEGKWAVDTAEEQGISAPVIKDAVQARFDSLVTQNYGSKIVSAMRFGFGKHREAD
ncbi:MAG: decarboxylating 6-phosphogluconate dehydrogenase [bacterium]|nr:decarboxylating 6-phosphogluconate dehydrogenase [bacterium]